MNQTSGLLGSAQAGSNAKSGAASGDAVQSFQMALNGFMSGQAGVANQTGAVANGLPTKEDGTLDIEAIKNMNPDELSAMLAAQGITPEMLLGVASQLLVSAQLNGASPEQLDAVEALRNNLAAGMDPEAVLAIETAAKNSVVSLLEVSQSANGKTGVSVAANASFGNGSSGNGMLGNSLLTNSLLGNPLLGEDALKTTVETIQQLSQILGVASAQKGNATPTNISAAVIAANEAELAAGVVLANSPQLTAGLTKSGVMANAPSDAGEFKPQDPQNIATTVLNAGNATQAQNQAATNATNATNADGVVADTKGGIVSAANSADGHSNANGGNAGNGQNANQQSSTANPLLEQIMQGSTKSNPFALAQQSGQQSGAVPTPSLQAQGVDIAAANTAQIMQPQTAQVASIFDGAIATEASVSVNHGGQVTTNGQTVANGLASVDGQSSVVSKESVTVTRPLSNLPQAVTHNIGMQISKAVSNGQTDFTVRIDPPELGRVNVKISFGNEGMMKAMVTVDTREALQLLQRDAHILERALGDLGSKLDQNSLNFSLNDQKNEGAQDGLSAKKDSGNGAEFDAALNGDEDIMNDILPLIDASRTLDIRI